MVPVTYNLRSLAARRTTTIVTALGIALVVFVLAAAMMLAEGVRKTLVKSGRDDTVIALSKGADSELASGIYKKHVNLLLAAPGVKRDKKGQPLGVSESVVVIIVSKRRGGKEYVSSVRVRGLTDNAFRFRPSVKLIRGRRAQPGTDEVIIGRKLVGRFEGMQLGKKIDLRKNRSVRIVGVFSAGDSSYESEIWADGDRLREIFGREMMVSSVRVRLQSPDAFEKFAGAIAENKQAGVDLMLEREYYEKQSEGTATFINILGTAIAFFFAIGAIIGAMITMHAAVASRRSEIGVLRAIGFSRGAVLRSFLFEAILLASLGGVVGAAASVGMSLVSFSMINITSWNEVVFRFTPTPEIMATAVLFGSLMGILGGLTPAIRAARIPPAEAIRNG